MVYLQLVALILVFCVIVFVVGRALHRKDEEAEYARRAANKEAREWLAGMDSGLAPPQQPAPGADRPVSGATDSADAEPQRASAVSLRG